MTADTLPTLKITYQCPRGHKLTRVYTPSMKITTTGIDCACGERMKVVNVENANKQKEGDA